MKDIKSIQQHKNKPQGLGFQASLEEYLSFFLFRCKIPLQIFPLSLSLLLSFIVLFFLGSPSPSCASPSHSRHSLCNNAVDWETSVHESTTLHSKSKSKALSRPGDLAMPMAMAVLTVLGWPTKTIVRFAQPCHPRQCMTLGRSPCQGCECVSALCAPGRTLREIKLHRCRNGEDGGKEKKGFRVCLGF